MIITLIDPKIPQNTGNIARLCAATRSPLHIVGNIGFELSDKYLKRAGLDYWPYVKWEYFEDTDAYIKNHLTPTNCHLLTTKGRASYTDHTYKETDHLVFGSETEGLPQAFRDQFASACCRIPMKEPNVRSLNLSTSVGIVLFEAIRQTSR